MLWNDNYLLGIEEVDNQHKKLVQLIEDTKKLLVDAQDGIDCYDELVAVLKELAEYTQYHFNCEEKLMEAVDYEDIIAHKMEHKIFIKKISSFMSEDLEEEQKEKIEELVKFLFDWLVRHIMNTDSKYVDFI